MLPGTATCRSGSAASRKRRRGGSSLIRRLFFVAFFFEVGLLLIVLPWSAFWERNYFGYLWPGLLPLLENDFIRGGVSGIGFVNLIAGFADLIPVLGMRKSPKEES